MTQRRQDDAGSHLSPSGRDRRARCVRSAPSTAFAAQQDLRSPDARDAARASYVDLRNPDTRDIAEARNATPYEPVVKVMQPVASSDAGLDWGDAGIGAGGMLGLVLLASAGTLAVTHRRGRNRRVATSA